MLKAFLNDRSGATAVEYGLIVVCLSLAIVASISRTGNTIEDMFSDPTRALQQTLD